MKSIKYILSLLIFGSISVGATEFVEPGGGYLIEASTPTVINWDNSKLPSPVKIELWNLENQAYSVIADSCADSTFTYSFSNLIADDLLRIKVTSLADSLQYQMSDSYFSVYIPEIISQKRSDGSDEIEINTSIAPNPIISDYTVINSTGISYLEIFTSNGESVYSESYSRVNSLTTPFKFTNQGVYCIKITDQDGIVSSKLVVVK